MRAISARSAQPTPPSPPGLPAGSVPIGGAKPPPPLNESQSNAATFADRMSQSNAILNDLDKNGTNPWSRLKEKVPGGNYLQSKEYQQYEQAKRDFINAQLRKESGATIQPSEFESADRQYFPQPGDDEKVIQQKRALRETAINGMRRAGGPSSQNQPAGPKTPAAGEPPPLPPGFRLVPPPSPGAMRLTPEQAAQSGAMVFR